MATAEWLPPPERPAWREFAAAPLVPLTVAFTIGVLVDRFAAGTVTLGLILAVSGAIAWRFVPLPYSRFALPLAIFGLGLAHHHAHIHEFPDNDVGQFIAEEKRLASARGILVEDPITRHRNLADPMVPARRNDYDVGLLDVTAIETEKGTWIPASGRLRLGVERPANDQTEPMHGLRAGDTAQAVGQWKRPRPPGNLGERDSNDTLRNQRVRGELRVSGDGSGIVRWDAAEWSTRRALAELRRRGSGTLNEQLPKSEATLARALLLGDGSAVDRAEWDAFQRTGVVHVLAISGQHLVLLAGFIWYALGFVGISRRRAAWVVMFVVVLYAVLTGFRPSAIRAAVMVVAACGSVILRRPRRTANSLAFAWLVVLIINPTDLFDLGFQLSFLSVYVLIYGVGKWVEPTPPTPTDELLLSLRPAWFRFGRSIFRGVAIAYAVNFAIFLANTPLLLAQQNVISPVGLLVGPILVVLTSIALVTGFALFLLSPIPLIADGLATVTRLSLAACDLVVHAADGWPGGVVYLPAPPQWWLLGFYALALPIPILPREYAKRLLLALGIWVALGLLWPNLAEDRPRGELRMTFLAVGHGGCTVLETPDGRCLLYDVGTTAGPDTVRYVIAPYLWSRGIRRVDEVFISHADADHFNGLAELARRFPVGRVTLTPSFAEKPTAQVAETFLVLRNRNIPVRTVSAGESFTAGDVRFDVLHPPMVGPNGSENERSLVMIVEHAGHRILLTGDIEKSGAAQLLNGPPQPVDVLQAPHHGSQAAYSPRWNFWAKPKLIVVGRGDLYTNFIRPADVPADAILWETETHGAITLRSHATGLTAENFRLRERKIVTRGGE